MSARTLVYEYWEVVAYLDGHRRGAVTAPFGSVHLPPHAFPTRAKAHAKARALRESGKAHAGLSYKVKRVRRWAKA